MGFFGLFLWAIGMFTMFADSGKPWIGIAFCLVGCLLLFIQIKINNYLPNSIKFYEEKSFYKDCIRAGIYDLGTQENLEKAACVAKNHRISFNNPYDLNEKFEKGKKYSEREIYSSFYKACFKQNVTDLSIPQNRQKAIDLAKQEYLIINDQKLDKAFKKAKKYFDKDLKEAELKEKKEAEKALEKRNQTEHNIIIADYDKLIKYSELYGREKRIAMIKAMMSPIEAQLKDIKQMEKDNEFVNMTLMRSGIQKENDWALWGGVAEGLGGLGAGISTAAEMQRENVEIRAHNEQQMAQNINLVGAMTSYQNNAIKDAEKENYKIHEKLRPYERMIKDAQSAVVSSRRGEDVIKELDFSNQKVTISPLGGFSVEVTVTQKNKLTVGFEDAVVDGTISAELRQKGKPVGQALCVLPLEGTAYESTIKGVCKTGANPNLPYELVFKPHKLWMIEKFKKFK